MNWKAQVQRITDITNYFYLTKMLHTMFSLNGKSIAKLVPFKPVTTLQSTGFVYCKIWLMSLIIELKVLPY